MSCHDALDPTKICAEGRMLGDVTTLADPAVVAMLQRQYREE
ncbi:MAG: hypothetical protein Q7U75_18220 [Desulfobacterales bacterium]|nr:hypothetical protein [Desulfobacterales bacterium]